MAKDKEPGVNGVAALYKARQLAERGTAPSDKVFADRYPNVFSLLTSNRVAHDKVADGAYLRISNAAGDWCFALGVPSLAAFTEVSAGTFEAGLDRLESILATGNASWRFNLRRPTLVRTLKSPEKST
jgi:hypothetical protein